MGEQGTGKGVWAGLILAVVAAVVFAVLWFLRGGDIDTLRGSMTRAESAATSTVERLEGELATARNAVTAETRKAADLETRLNDELRAAQAAGRTAESSLRAELSAANDQIARNAVTITGLEQAAAESGRRAGVIADLETKIAELEQNGVEARQSIAAAAQELAKAREAATAANAAKTQLEARVNDATAQSAAALSEAGSLREELAAAKSAAETERAAANETAAALRKQIADLRAAAAAVTTTTPAVTAAPTAAALAPEIARLAGELAAARKLAVERETAHRDANDALRTDITSLQNEIAALRESAAGNGSALAAQLEAVRRESAEREAELRADANKARAAADGMRAEITASRASIVDANQLIGELDTRLYTANTAREQLLKQTDGLRQRLSASRKHGNELEAASNASREQLLKQADGLRERLSASRKRANELETTLAKKVAALELETRTVREETTRLVNDMRSQLDAAKAEASKQPPAVTVSVTPPAAVTTPVPATPAKPAAPAAPATAAAAIAPAITDARRPALTIVSDPQKHFGQLVELLSDGKTWLVSTAGGKGLKVGSRFDIHRDANNRILYIGQMEIVSLLPDGFAMAALRADDAPVGICPATGRAVRFAQESPFARTADGTPIAPVRSGAPAAAKPAVGDVIDCQI